LVWPGSQQATVTSPSATRPRTRSTCFFASNFSSLFKLKLYIHRSTVRANPEFSRTAWGALHSAFRIGSPRPILLAVAPSSKCPHFGKASPGASDDPTSSEGDDEYLRKEPCRRGS